MGCFHFSILFFYPMPDFKFFSKFFAFLKIKSFPVYVAYLGKTVCLCL